MSSVCEHFAHKAATSKHDHLSRVGSIEELNNFRVVWQKKKKQSNQKKLFSLWTILKRRCWADFLGQLIAHRFEVRTSSHLDFKAPWREQIITKHGPRNLRCSCDVEPSLEDLGSWLLTNGSPLIVCWSRQTEACVKSEEPQHLTESVKTIAGKQIHVLLNSSLERKVVRPNPRPLLPLYSSFSVLKLFKLSR